jgi:hypothetical protein
MLGTLGIVGVVYLAATFFVMHFIQPELNPIDHQMSEYANGRLGWLVVSGDVVGGLGVLALAIGLSRSLKPGKRVRTSVILTSLVGLGFIGSGLFKTDIPLEDGTVGYTFSGQMHTLAGIVAFLSLIVASYMLAGVFVRDPRWQPFARTARLFAWGILITFLGYLAAPIVGAPGTGGIDGLAQRIFVAVVLTWLVWIGWHMRQPRAVASSDLD